jgi:hypothetical protein
MPLPPSRKAGLRAGRQMQVESCEIPLAGAPEILRKERFQTVPYGAGNNLPC